MVFNITRTSPILFGNGSSLQTGAKVKELGCKKVICITDQGVRAAGIADNIIRSLETAGIKVIVYDGVLPDPPVHIIEECAAVARNEQVDGIVGIGGGSSMDAAKAVNVLLGNPSPITRYFDMSVPQLPGKVLVLIPTTAGTGSEVTAISVISDTWSNKKAGVIGATCKAALAIVDPELTVGLPAAITAATGMDTFSHAAEALTSALANPMSDILAEKAIALTTRYLPQAVQNGSDLAVRNNLSLASMIAGVAFNDALPHLGHAIAHTLGASHHIPHGTACAIALPEVIAYVVDTVPEKVKTLGIAMGLDLAGLSVQETGIAVAEAIKRLNSQIGIATMKELNIDKSSLEKIAAETLQDGCAMFTPKKATRDDILAMLNKAYESGLEV